jgi:hypothetical protein
MEAAYSEAADRLIGDLPPRVRAALADATVTVVNGSFFSFTTADLERRPDLKPLVGQPKAATLRVNLPGATSGVQLRFVGGVKQEPTEYGDRTRPGDTYALRLDQPLQDFTQGLAEATLTIDPTKAYTRPPQFQLPSGVYLTKEASTALSPEKAEQAIKSVTGFLKSFDPTTEEGPAPYMAAHTALRDGYPLGDDGEAHPQDNGSIVVDAGLEAERERLTEENPRLAATALRLADKGTIVIGAPDPDGKVTVTVMYKGDAVTIPLVDSGDLVLKIHGPHDRTEIGDDGDPVWGEDRDTRELKVEMPLSFLADQVPARRPTSLFTVAISNSPAPTAVPGSQGIAVTATPARYDQPAPASVTADATSLPQYRGNTGATTIKVA